MARTPKGLPGPAVVRAVLRDINALRARCHLPPLRAILRGRKGSSLQNPIARTLGYEKGVSGSTTDHGLFVALMIILERLDVSMMWQASKTTATFLRDFDAGKYPGLELP